MKPMPDALKLVLNLVQNAPYLIAILYSLCRSFETGDVEFLNKLMKLDYKILNPIPRLSCCVGSIGIHYESQLITEGRKLCPVVLQGKQKIINSTSRV